MQKLTDTRDFPYGARCICHLLGIKIQLQHSHGDEGRYKRITIDKMLDIHCPEATIIGNNELATAAWFWQVRTELERGSMLWELSGR